MTDTEIKAAIHEGLAQIGPESDPAELSRNENIRRTLDIDSFDFLKFLIGQRARVEVNRERRMPNPRQTSSPCRSSWPSGTR